VAVVAEDKVVLVVTGVLRQSKVLGFLHRDVCLLVLAPVMMIHFFVAPLVDLAVVAVKAKDTVSQP
jgi:hypothetical protein